MTGFRVGYMRAAPELVGVAVKVQEAFVSCGVPFAQLGAVVRRVGSSTGCLRHTSTHAARTNKRECDFVTRRRRWKAQATVWTTVLACTARAETQQWRCCSSMACTSVRFPCGCH